MRKSIKLFIFSLFTLLVTAFSCSLLSPRIAKPALAEDGDEAYKSFVIIGDHQKTPWDPTDDDFVMQNNPDGGFIRKDMHWTEGQKWRIILAPFISIDDANVGWSDLQNKEDFVDDFKDAGSDNNIECLRDWRYDIVLKIHFKDETAEIFVDDAAYSVTLNKNGGEIIDGDDINSYSYGDDAKKLPTLSKEGCTFLGWYDNPEFNGQPIEWIYEREHGNKTFYAKYSAERYALTYELNGGNFESGIEEGTYDKNTLITQPTVTKKDYELTSWTNGYGQSVTFPFNLVENTKLVANWRATASYTISFSVNNQNYGAVSSESVEVPAGTTATIIDNKIRFNDTEIVATPREPVSAAAYRFVEWQGIEQGQEITKNLEVTANFEEITREHSLKWEFNGGTPSSDQYSQNGTYLYNAEIIAPDEIIKEGKYFDGFYDNPDFDGDAYDFPYNIVKDITFYVKWVDKHTLTIINTDERAAQAEFTNLKHDSFESFPTIESIFGNDFHEPFGRYYVGLKADPSSQETPIKGVRITSDLTYYACYAFRDPNYYQYSFDGINYSPFEGIRDADSGETGCIKVYFKGGLNVTRGSQLYLKANNQVITFDPIANTNLTSDGKVKVGAKNVFLDLKLTSSGTYLVHIGGMPDSDGPYISVDGNLSKLTKSPTADEYYIQSIAINSNQIVEAYWGQYYACYLDEWVSSDYFETNSDGKIVCKKNGCYDAYLKCTGTDSAGSHYDKIYLAPHGLNEALLYAENFLNQMSKICKITQNGGDITSLKNEWSNEKTLFNDLADESSRVWLTDAFPIEDGSDLEKFAALYDYIYVKYGSKVGDNFANRNVISTNSSQNIVLFGINNSTTWIIIVSFAIVGVVSISAYIIKRKHLD